jgi:hypothetical protein
LAEHLDSQEISFNQFAWRWIMGFLIHDIPFHLVLRLFDSYLSDEQGPSHGFKITHVYVCALCSLHGALLSLDTGNLLRF